MFVMIGLCCIAIALLAASAAVVGAPANSSHGSILAISRRPNSLLYSGTNRVNLTAVSRHTDMLRRKYTASLRAFEQNTGRKHPFEATNYTPSQGDERVATKSGSEPLMEVNEGQFWSGSVTFGGSQQVQLSFDTGSADLVLDHSLYKPGPTARDTGRQFVAPYADGTYGVGPVYEDDFAVAGLKTRATLGYSNTDFFKPEGTPPTAGYAGLGFANNAALHAPPFFDALVHAHAVSRAIFTVSLDSHGTSRIFLGGVDPAVQTKDVVHFPADPHQGYWAASGTLNGRPIEGIHDTGATLIVMPTEDARALYRSLHIATFEQDANLFGVVDCNGPLPKLTFKFGAFSDTLSGENAYFGYFTDDGRCVLSIVGAELGLLTVTIMGDPWFLGKRVLFDQEQTRLGLVRV